MRIRSRKLVLVLAFLVPATFAALWLLPAGRNLAQDLQAVLVTNLPEVQEVAGQVRVPEPIPHTRLETLGEILVPPAQRDDPTQLVSGGELRTDGFTRVVLSLSGEVKGKALRPGQVGAILIPTEEPVMTALREEELYSFPLEVSAPVSVTAGAVASTPKELTVAFPRYKVFFYNGSDRTVGVHLFAYLAH